MYVIVKDVLVKSLTLNYDSSSLCVIPPSVFNVFNIL